MVNNWYVGLKHKKHFKYDIAFAFRSDTYPNRTTHPGVYDILGPFHTRHIAEFLVENYDFIPLEERTVGRITYMAERANAGIIKRGRIKGDRKEK